VLAQRLRELERAEVVRRRTLPPPAASQVYELTDWGAELEPVLVALGRWGSRAPIPGDAPALGIDAAVVALQTTFEPAAAAGSEGTYELQLGDQEFSIQVTSGALQVTRGRLAPAAARIETDLATLAAVVWHGRPVADAIEAGSLTILGDPEAGRRFVGLFSAPVPA
jgi:hypothetical protein